MKQSAANRFRQLLHRVPATSSLEVQFLTLGFGLNFQFSHSYWFSFPLSLHERLEPSSTIMPQMWLREIQGVFIRSDWSDVLIAYKNVAFCLFQVTSGKVATRGEVEI